jgi:hypothetical protein
LKKKCKGKERAKRQKGVKTEKGGKAGAKMGNRQGPGRPMSSWEGEYLILIMNII